MSEDERAYNSIYDEKPPVYRYEVKLTGDDDQDPIITKHLGDVLYNVLKKSSSDNTYAEKAEPLFKALYSDSPETSKKIKFDNLFDLLLTDQDLQNAFCYDAKKENLAIADELVDAYDDSRLDLSDYVGEDNLFSYADDEIRDREEMRA